MDIDASMRDFECYYSLEKLADMAGITPEGLRNKLCELSYMDESDRPLEKALKSKTSNYRFYAEEGHLEGEWLWHKDLLLAFECNTVDRAL